MSHDDLIAKIKSGGEAELAMLYEEHRSAFVQWMKKEFQCSDDDGRDIYQLTILVFIDNIRSGKLEHLVSSVKTYLYGIGKNIVRDNMRKASRQMSIDQQQWLVDYVSDEPASPEGEKKFEAAKRALAKLGEPCKRLVELFYYERRSLDDIAGIMNYKNPETAKNQKCKCMKRLRQLCENEMRNTSLTIDHEY